MSWCGSVWIPLVGLMDILYYITNRWKYEGRKAAYIYNTQIYKYKYERIPIHYMNIYLSLIVHIVSAFSIAQRYFNIIQVNGLGKIIESYLSTIV